jgi:hypothetical protein
MLHAPVTPRTIPQGWSGTDLAADSSWKLPLTIAHISELEKALAHAKSKVSKYADLTKSDFPLGRSLAGLVDRIRTELTVGRGVVLLSGFPVQRLSEDDLGLCYWGLCIHLGTCVSQDGQAALLAKVEERGIKQATLTRAYGTRRVHSLHVDLSDVIGLLCVRQASSNPISSFASAIAVYNEFVFKHPEWLPRLQEGFHWDRYGEHAAWEAPTSSHPIPVFDRRDGRFSSRFNRNWIKAAAVRRNAPLTDTEDAMLDFFDAMAQRHAFTFELAEGDAYFANNLCALHGRAGYEEDTGESLGRGRLLLRSWINLPELRPSPDRGAVHYGLIDYGNLGWTAGELAVGKNLSAGHQRVFCE